jgi:hypothetical protein
VRVRGDGGAAEAKAEGAARRIDGGGRRREAEGAGAESMSRGRSVQDGVA